MIGDIDKYGELHMLACSYHYNWRHELTHRAYKLNVITLDQSKLMELLLNYSDEFRIWMKTMNL